MLSVAEALHLVLEHAASKSSTEIDLASACGLVLNENVLADIDSPPHDKSLVDGYAVLAADLVDGRARLQLLEEITAGAVPTYAIKSGCCTRLMTGAPLPDGADAVVMLEQTSSPSGGWIEIRDDRFRPGQHIMLRGHSFRKGNVLVNSGTELGPAEIGLLAEVGRAFVQVVWPARVAILSTGNELVASDQTPGPGAIRNSNGPLLMAACQKVGACPTNLGIARDDIAELRDKISTGLRHDVLIVSGGVSAGVLDLVPSVLKELEVREVFHKVSLKPGKPVWFGIATKQELIQNVHIDFRAPPTSTLVFGLPGNPVSSLVCFELFVKPAIARIAGRHSESPHDTRPAKLTREFNHRGDRPTYHPAVLVASPDGPMVEPTVWKGSADLRGFAGANALIVFPAGDKTYRAGDAVEVLSL
jgi:molybdopterin molybdotransferase